MTSDAPGLREAVRLEPRHVLGVAWRSVVVLAVGNVTLGVPFAFSWYGFWLVVLLVAVPVFAVVALAVGVPVGLLVARLLRGRPQWAHVLAFAASGGVVGAAALGLVLRDAPGAGGLALLGFAEGAVGAGVACWWTLARIRRPRTPRVPRYVPDELVEDVAVDRQLGILPPPRRDAP
jgi:hypothetical protein